MIPSQTTGGKDEPNIEHFLNFATYSLLTFQFQKCDSYIILAFHFQYIITYNVLVLFFKTFLQRHS